METEEPIVTDESDHADPDTPTFEQEDMIDLDVSDKEFASSLLSIDYTKEQYSFKPDQVESILVRLFEIVEKQADEKANDGRNERRKSVFNDELDRLFIYEYGRLFAPEVRDPERENIQDQVVLAVTKIALSGAHLAACHHILEQNVLQQVQMINPEALFACSRELNWYDQLDYDPDQREAITRIRRSFSDWMSYDADYNPEKLIDFAKKSMAKDDSFENIVKTMSQVRNVFNSLINEGYSNDQSLDSLQNIVGMAWRENDNYLIRAIAENNIAEMSRGEDYQNNAMISGWADRQNGNAQKLQGMMSIDLAPDEIGLYDYKGNLQGVAKAGEERAQKLNSISILGDKNKLDEAQNVKEFSLLLSLPMRSVIEADFGIDLSQLDFSVQYYFLNFLKSRSGQEARSLADFTKKFGADGFKTFLSLDSGEEMSNTIFEIGEKFPEENAKQIFAKYGEIVDATGKVRDHLKDQFGEEKSFDEAVVEKIIRGLLNKGKRLLIEFSKKEKPDDGELISDLESYKAEIMLFASTFKALRESGEAPKLEELPGFSIDTVDSGDLTENQRGHMINTFADNWSGFPEVRDKLLASFKHALETPGKKFYLLKYGKDIIGFIRFDEISDDELLAASFNVDKNANGSGIGEAILKNYLAKEAEDHLISGYAYPRSPIVHRYIGEFGFVITDIIPNYKGTGEPFFKIERDDEARADLKFFNASNEAVIRAGINERSSKSHFIQTFDTKTEEGMRELESVCASYLHEGYIITAYRETTKGSGQFYTVFEKPLKTLSERERELIAA